MTEIEEAELQLYKLKLGVTAKVQMPEPGMWLVFTKEDKLWRLMLEFAVDAPGEYETTMAPLANASPEYQEAALRLLPEMYEALLVEAERLIAEMKQAVANVRPWLEGLRDLRPKVQKRK